MTEERWKLRPGGDAVVVNPLTGDRWSGRVIAVTDEPAVLLWDGIQRIMLPKAWAQPAGPEPTERPTEALEQAMTEYAQAQRSDWSDFDGRSAQAVVSGWVEEMRQPSGRTIEQWREELGLCPYGKGHWESPYCEEYGCGQWGTGGARR